MPDVRSKPEAVLRGGLRLRATVAALGVAVLAGGCGDDRLPKGEYAAKVRTAYGDVRTAVRTLGGKRKGESLQSLGRRIGAAGRRVDHEAERLEQVEPPKDVEEPHEEFVEGLRGYADELAQLAGRVSRGDAGAIARFNKQLPENESVKRLSEASEQMLARGYDVGVEPD